MYYGTSDEPREMSPGVEFPSSSTNPYNNTSVQNQYKTMQTIQNPYPDTTPPHPMARPNP